MAYLDNTGLSYLWGKIKSALSAKQNKITAAGLLKGDGAGGVTEAEAGTDYLLPGSQTLPTVTTDDNGKFLRVVSGAWTAAEGSSSAGLLGDDIMECLINANMLAAVSTQGKILTDADGSVLLM